MTPEAAYDAFRRTVEQILDNARVANQVPDFEGAPVLDMLEHTTRRVALDPLLEALGWSFADRTEEARVSGDETLFIDYLGIDRQSRAAELIFEAKAYNASIIAGKSKYLGRPAAELAAAAVNHLKGEGSSTAPLTKEWMDRIKQIRDYVRGIQETNGSVVQRVAIGCARWIIIFKNPGQAFVEPGETVADDILALVETTMVKRSDDIFDLLSAGALRNVPRAPIHADEIRLRLSDPTEIHRVFRAVHVSNSETRDEWAPQPSLNVAAWLIVERQDGALIPVRQRGVPVTLPASQEFLSAHIARLKELSDEMLEAAAQALGTELPAPSPIGIFSNFPTRNGSTSPVRRSSKGGNFLVATGKEAHYLRALPEVESCPFHHHERCRQVGAADEDEPVTIRSHRRLSFFTSGEVHHCAHRQIHIAKQSVQCPISGFETKLCCRACTLQSHCWSPGKLSTAPCGGPTQNVLIPADTGEAHPG